MELIVAGISHTTAPIEIREKIGFRAHEALRELERLRESGIIREGVALSTCNRTEIYAVERDGDALPHISTMLSHRLGADATRFMYVRRERNVAAHLFSVAAGLDSMILGEAQIHGQVKQAWEECRAESGPILNRMFQTALLAASRARDETGIGRGAASVSSAAVQLAKKIFGGMSGRRAMILGAGDVAELALECLLNEGVHVAIVANRTYERALALAERHGATAMHYDECWESLKDVDVLLCSTASPVPVVTVERVKDSVVARGDRPLCVLDIALPRDVEVAVGELDNVFLYDLDDLRAAAAANLERREENLPAAQKIIAEESQKYWDWVAGLAAVPVVRSFREEMDRVRSTELAAALRRMGPLSAEQTETIEHFSKALMNKFMHEPSVRLKAAAANGRGLGVVDAARYLFALEDKAQPGAASTPRKMPKALVTGGAGFIGSHVADAFIANGWDVTIVDDLSSGKRENIPANARFHEIGVNSPEFSTLVSSGKFDIVAHLASQIDVRKSVADPIADANTNILGTLNLMETLRRNGAGTRVVFTSTGGVLYGDFNTPPNFETYPKDPESPYAISKLSIEYYLAYYSRVHDREYAAVRFGNVYGPRQDPHGEAGVVAIFCGRILDKRPLTVFGDGLQTRDYVYVGDVARAVLLAATKPLPAKGRLDARGFNIGTGKGTSVLEIAKLLQKTAGSSTPLEFAPHRPGEQQESFVNADKARDLLGWAPEVTLADGLAKTYAWFADKRKGASV